MLKLRPFCGDLFNVTDLIEKTIKKYENSNIISELDEKIQMFGRKNLIQRCLNNLIDNGIKYANKINIKLTKNNKFIIIILDDDGPGIPKKEYENVFKPFYKANKSRGDSKSSVGLGLSIASDVINSHGGNITLNESPQNGLSFNILFPF